MNKQLAEGLRAGRGLVHGAQHGQWVLKQAVRSGLLVRLFPSVYGDAALMDRLSPSGQFHLRCRAAVLYTRGQGTISHTAALSVYGFLPPTAKVHVTVAAAIRQRTVRGLVVHHHETVSMGLRRSGVILSPPAETIVYAWPMLSPEARIGAVVGAAEARLVTTNQIRKQLKQAPRLKDRADLRKLLTHIDGGCHSPLEVYGAQHVFTGVGFVHVKRQHPVHVEGRTFYLDVFAEQEAVNFELDGTAFHGNAVQRERDLKRDALLAGKGILVVRFSYARLMTEPAVVRAEALKILASRR